MLSGACGRVVLVAEWCLWSGGACGRGARHAVVGSNSSNVTTSVG